MSDHVTGAKIAGLIEPGALEEALRESAPEAVLVPPRVLRRVIKLTHGAGLLHSVPHRKVLAISRERLLELVEQDELELEPGQELRPQVILLPLPHVSQLAGTLAGQVLIKYWRLVFHARVHLALEARRAEGKLTEADVRARLDRIGQIEADELRSVLTQENFLTSDADAFAVYAEIAAVVLELKAFVPWLLPSYFPGLTDVARVESVLADDVDAAALFADSRPAGAPDPVALGDRGAQAKCSRLLREAKAAADRGNRVRAAQLSRRAAKLVPAPFAPALEAQIQLHVTALAEGLRLALHQDEARGAEWVAALTALLTPASSDLLGTAARVLSDFQKIALAHGHTAYRLDLAGYVLSAGQQPLQRELPLQGDVLTVKYLRRVRRRLARVVLSDADRARVVDAVRHATRQAEKRLRDRCRAPLEEALKSVGLVPRNYPERVARERVVEQLLDRIVSVGFATFSDLRDVLSRSPLKQDDVRDAADWWTGTPLLRADRLLGRSLEGVYRPGEAYLRGLQRASSLAFATRPGRAFTLFVALPLLAALATLIVIEEIAEKLLRLHVHLAKPSYFLALAAFFLVVLHHEGFRGVVCSGLRAAGRGLLYMVGVPAAIFRSKAFLAVYESAPFELFRRRALRPLATAALATAVAWFTGVTGLRLALVAAGTLCAAGLFFSSRLALRFQESLSDWVGLNWQWLSKDVLPGLFQLIVDFFRALLDSLERLLFTIESWLRFRSGESQVVMWAKAVFGLAWSIVAYVVRFCVNLLIEPQINPIKHFPVVTVSHKLLLPMVPHVGGLLAVTFQMERVAANSAAFTFMSMIPGIFGFLAWELNANWKLYAANRAETIEPLAIGSHGETMLRFLAPGFHSGTIPRLFARLRRAERRRDKRSGRHLREELHHAAQAIETFVERELCELLAASPGWGTERPHVGHIELHSNRIQIPLTMAAQAAFAGAEPLEITFEEQSHWLVGSVSKAGWLERLTPRQRETFAVALAGAYALAGVDFTREQLARALGTENPPYDICDRGLVVWPGGDYATEVVFALDREGPPLSIGQTFFLPEGLSWARWVEFWESDQSGKTPLPPVAPGVVLPSV